MRFLIILTTFFFSLIFFAAGSIFYIIQNTSLDNFTLSLYSTAKPTIVLDDQGNEWARFELYHRQPIALSHIPTHLIQAFLAAEDHDFFKHPGISWRGIVRSLFVNLLRGRAIQGASTITQQLTRLLFFDNKKSFVRKIKEQFYALLIEGQFTKEQILETYLNHIYLGGGIYGIQAACYIFWHKPIEDITLHEAATLAAIIKSPAHYCPLLDPQKAQKRRNIILHSMFKLKFISAAEYEQAKKQPLITLPNNDTTCAPHLKEFIRIQLEKLLGKQNLYNNGYTVQTTLNRAIQNNASTVFMQHLRTLRKNLHIPLDGALITLDVSTAAIKALIGGYDFTSSCLNRGTQIKRQIGSLIKPLIYAQALTTGLTLAATEIDEPFELIYDNQTWTPRNVNRIFQGEMTLAHALATSNNIIAIKLLLRVGIENIITLLKKCYIGDDIKAYPSLALGCIETCPLKTAALFNIFAHAGTYHEPYIIEWIKDAQGKKIYKHTPYTEQIIPWSIASQINCGLRISSQRLQERAHLYLKGTSIAKTGTTNDARTCCFAGSTPDYTTAIYLGCDDNRPLQNVYASTTAFPLWFDVHKELPLQHKTFIDDQNLKKITINPLTGENAEEGIEILVPFSSV
ncbi:MAG: transglycosylase domain-containing protein [Candidatus Babeliaceae bacterium]